MNSELYFHKASLMERMVAHFELIKPRVTSMVVLSAAAGFYIAAPVDLDLILLFHASWGTALIAAGTAAMNELMEREADSKMRRTSARPLPSGRIREKTAAILGGLLVGGGVIYLSVLTNLLATFLACGTSVVYLLVYTPLKVRTPMCTTVGAIPGAAPPLIGWAAATGSLDSSALLLFAILFAWQFPHFLAIAWIYRDDYLRGGFAMLPSVDPDGRRTSRRILGFSIVLFFLSVIPWMWGLTGIVYLIGAVFLGLTFLWFGLQVALSCSTNSARHVLKASVVYLPLLLTLMVIDKSGV